MLTHVSRRVRFIYNWYRIYCYYSASINYAVGGLGVYLLLTRANWIDYENDRTVWIWILAWAAVLVGPLFGTVSVLLPRLRHNRVTYGIHFANVLMGISVCPLTPVALPLAFKWFDPEVKSYFDQAGQSSS